MTFSENRKSGAPHQFNVRIYQCADDRDEYVYSARSTWERANEIAKTISQAGFELTEVVQHQYPGMPIAVVQYRNGVKKVISVVDAARADSESRMAVAS